MSYQLQQQVPSSSGRGTYTVSLTDAGEWQCSCVGWTRHMPRKDCKHIRTVQSGRNVTLPSGAVIARDKYRLSGSLPRKADHVHPVSSGDVLSGRVDPATARANSDARADAETASRQAVAKREAFEQKKAAKLGKLRFGFQLAETYEPADLMRGKWIAEIKYDGELGMLIDGRIINRSGNDVTHRFPEIQKVTDAVLVGELVILEGGLSRFNKIQERNTDDPIKIAAAAKANPARFMAFDMLESDQLDLTDMPLVERRRFMTTYFWLHPLQGVEMTEQMPVSSDKEVQALVDACRKMETEGIMLKDLNAIYDAKRGRNWVKAKTWQEREFNVVRFEDTGVGDGFVLYIQNKSHEQRVVCNSLQMREQIRKGHKRVEIKFLSEGEDGAMRFPSLRRLV